MEQFCRVCRDNDAALVDIFMDRYENENEPTLAEMLSDCTGCEVLRDDPLPQKMCMACVLAAQHFFRFKRKCEQSHQYFWQQLNTNEMLEADDWHLAQWAKCETSVKVKEEESPEREEIWQENVAPMTQIFIYNENELVTSNDWKSNSCPAKRDVKIETSSTSSSSGPLVSSKSNVPMARQDSKSHICATCNKKFVSKRKLNLHKRVHARKRKYKCPHCEKEFVNSGNLADHIRAHTGERPFKCPHCTKAFTQRGRLNEHIRIHTGERPFKCLHCPRCFASSGNLTAHNRTHNEEKPYKCKQCEASFMQSGSLQRHARIHVQRESI